MPNQFKEDIQISLYQEICERNLKLLRAIDKVNLTNQNLLTKIANLQSEKEALNKDFDDLREEFKENLNKLERQHKEDVDNLHYEQTLNKLSNIIFDNDDFPNHFICFLIILLVSLSLNIKNFTSFKKTYLNNN